MKQPWRPDSASCVSRRWFGSCAPIALRLSLSVTYPTNMNTRWTPTQRVRDGNETDGHKTRTGGTERPHKPYEHRLGRRHARPRAAYAHAARSQHRHHRVAAHGPGSNAWSLIAKILGGGFHVVRNLALVQHWVDPRVGGRVDAQQMIILSSPDHHTHLLHSCWRSVQRRWLLYGRLARAAAKPLSATKTMPRVVLPVYRDI